jgi:predicted DNA-binding ribbon-helix-helix protein
MRTTVYLEDPLLIEAKKYAAERGTTLTALIADSLREVLLRERKRNPAKKIRLTTVKGEGLQSGIDLDSNSSLLDVMEGS